MTTLFENRLAAGRALAGELAGYRDKSGLLVLGLPRGGVPVAWEVAEALNAELDVLVVRKLGLPQQPELAFGAIASGGARVFNQDVLQFSNLDNEQIETIIHHEQAELQRRETTYRGNRRPFVARNRPVILVDDGLATGATMAAAVTALRSLQPQKIVVAVPVASPEAIARVEPLVDKIVCLLTPDYFSSVGQWYRDFGQTSDDEVRALLETGD